MALPLHLAMTAGEFDANPLPAFPAYMACHFAAYGNGLQDLPPVLPDGCMLILDDRIPVWNHDPEIIAEELHSVISRYRCRMCLLDLQRPGEPLTQAIAQHIIDTLPCPVVVSEAYAEGLKGGVLINSPLPNQPLSSKAQLWKGRELWLEVVPETIRYTITKEGSKRETVDTAPEDFPHRDLRLCCGYRVETYPDKAVFTIGRAWEDLQKLMEQASEMGFSGAVGLYQQLGSNL